MKKPQIKIPAHCISIKTPIQANFHLDRGETLALPVTKTISIFIKKLPEEENQYDLALVPLFGKSKVFTGTFSSVSALIEDYEFMVLQKASLRDRKPGLIDHVFNFIAWISRLKGRK